MSEEVRLPVKIGELVAGKYRIERVLGVGGMGAVMAATHVGLGQRVAIKFLLADARAVSGVTDRFANEARASARLKSDHVVRVLDVDALADGTPYMVMEYLEGKDLSQIISSRRRLHVDETCDYVLQACEALAEAHANGIVHRDLKPGNLFVTHAPDGTEIVKLLDFGISKNIGPDGDFSLTKTSAVLGSPLYMPPEQMSSARGVDSRADIWSLGIVLYEAVTGTMPFEGLTLTSIVATIIQEPPKPMSATGIVLPEGFEAVVLRCLEKSPARRFATVGELANALAPFAPRKSGSSLDRISRLEAMTPPGAQPRPPVSPSEPPIDLVRVRRIEPKIEMDTVLRARGIPAAAATHAAQMLDPPRRRRARDSLDRPEQGSWGWLVVMALALVMGGVLIAHLWSQQPELRARLLRALPILGSHPPPDGPPSPAPAENASPPAPVAADPPVAPPAETGAAPAPPPTHSADPPPPPSALPTSVSVKPPPPPTAAPASRPPAAPTPRPSRAQHPSAPPTSIDMVPK